MVDFDTSAIFIKQGGKYGSISLGRMIIKILVEDIYVWKTINEECKAYDMISLRAEIYIYIYICKV